jgi:hypothetical protein
MARLTILAWHHPQGSRGTTIVPGRRSCLEGDAQRAATKEVTIESNQARETATP